jgi:hypothetical protein
MDMTKKKLVQGFVAALFAGILLLAASCGAVDRLGGMSGRSEKSAAPTAPSEYEESASGERESMKREAPEGAEAPDLLPESVEASAPAAGADAGGSETGGAEADEQTAAGEPKKEERKRVYSGFAELLVDNVEQTKMEATTIAENAGGYVENSYEDSITIRVPAEDFPVIFKRVMDLGEVLDSYEETIDVTDYYADLEKRLEIAKETRARLYELLERTEDVDERIEILREIRRLTEEIERIELRFEVLKEYITYSTITLKLVSRLDYDNRPAVNIPFDWIDGLHPLYPVSNKVKGRVKADLPEQFAVFEKENFFRAETPEGVRLRVSSVENSPEGTARFWQDALAFHLAKKFAEAEKRDAGGFPGVLLESKDPSPYFYYVGVQVEKKHIHLAEVFFPDREAFEEYEGMLDDLGKGVTVQ